MLAQFGFLPAIELNFSFCSGFSFSGWKTVIQQYRPDKIIFGHDFSVERLVDDASDGEGEVFFRQGQKTRCIKPFGIVLGKVIDLRRKVKLVILRNGDVTKVGVEHQKVHLLCAFVKTPAVKVVHTYADFI